MKTLWQKEKLLVLSNFSFCHNVFKSCLLQMLKNASSCGKRLNNKSFIMFFLTLIISFVRISEIYPFPTYRSFLTPLELASFENIVTKDEIAQNEPFLLWPQCFQLMPVSKPSYIKIFVFLIRCVQICLLQICCMWERVKKIKF